MNNAMNLSESNRPTVSGRIYTATRKRGFADWRPQRRSQHLLDQVLDVLGEYADFLPLTARQIFYRLVAKFLYPKDENGYTRLLDLLNNARRARLIPFDSIRDDGATVSAPSGFDGPESFWGAVDHTAHRYRRNRLAVQPQRIEIWCEGAGMVPQLARIAHPFGITVYSGGGFDSSTAKHDAAQRIAADPRRTVILHLGDYDPSGVALLDSVASDVDAFLDDLGGDAEWRRVAVTPDQIRHFDLPAAPAKAGDRRGGDWIGGTVQCESLTPTALAEALESALAAVIDQAAHAAILAIEEQEREELIDAVGEAREGIR